MPATILGVDTSHFQGMPNWAQVKASGRSFAVMKATEGTSYADPTLAGNRKAARAAGLIVGLYHFARAGNAAAEAGWFVKTIGALQPGEFLVLDWEVPGANPPAWCKTWLDAVAAATGVRPLIYLNQSAVNGSNWGPVASTYGLWLAKYDQSTAQPRVAHWGAAAMKQFSDKGSVPGIAGLCDVDVFYGTEAQLLPYGSSKGDDDMPLTDDDLRRVHDAIWHGVSGAKLIDNPRLGRGEWAGTTLGAMEGRFASGEIALPGLVALQGQVAGLTEALKQLAAAPGQAINLAEIRAAVDAAVKSSIESIDVTVRTGDGQAS